MKTNFYVECQGTKISTKRCEDAIKEAWKAEGGRVKDIVSLDVYYKPDEMNCYYVINNKHSGCLKPEAE